ncbi:hypothetical protein HQ533_02640 [Candidatus Woesearchaeota archaeon]|nr:hypothetical protein [Candidatus Woesearchaeota archaeon]
MKRRILITILLLTFLLVSSCSGRGPDYPSNPERDRYYVGTEGVRMLIDPGAPPPRMYYYGDAPSEEYNTFSVDVELQNEGASWTKGGLYVSGYDPSLIFFDDINIPKTNTGLFDNCRVDLDLKDLSWDNIGGFLSCRTPSGTGFEIMGDPTTGQLIDGTRINNIFQLFGCDSCPEVDVNWDRGTEHFNFNFDFSAFGLDLDLLHHGQALIVILDSLSFDRFNGKSFILAPDNYNYPGGESTLLAFQGHIKDSWPSGLDETDVTFLVSSCYIYTTYATPVVCIDPAPFSQDEKVCYPGQIDLKGSQGAPVAVSRVIQENTPRSVIFTIVVQNVGRGEVINAGYMELCSPYYPGRLSPQDMDLVILGDIRLSGSQQRLRCVPDNNLIRLRDGRGQISCTYDLEYATAKSAYKAPLVVELWYGYRESQRRNINIKRVS